mgnify:CR=1 FL=1
MKWKWLISLGLVVCLVVAFTLPACAPAPPVEEEKPPVEEEKPPVEEEEELAKSINAYMCSSKNSNAKAVAYMKEKLGVTINQHFESVGVVHAKLKAEAPRFNADIVSHVSFPVAFDAKNNGWAIPYDSPTWRDADFPFKDPDNYWVNIGTSLFLLVYNEEMLAEKGYEAPKSWEDLLDPKWKGQIVMPSPVSSGTGYRILYTFLTEYGFNAGKGEEGGWEFYEELNKNVHHYTKSGSTPVDLVTRKEFMLGLSVTSGIADRIKEGYPIKWFIPEGGTGYDLAAVFILKGTKEEYTCQKIVDEFGTLEFAQYLATYSGLVSRYTQAHNALFGEYVPNWVPNIDPEWLSVNKGRLLDEWKDRIGRVAE